MSDTPDLGKIVSLIMENPDLIARIQSLAKGDEGKEAANTTEQKEVEAVAPVAVSAPIAPDPRDKRNRLLSAMKPYLSGERAKAIDSMMSVAEILDMMKPR